MRLGLSILILFALIGLTSCKHPMRRTNYLAGFCGQKKNFDTTEVIGLVKSKHFNPGDGDSIIDIVPDKPYRRLLYEIKYNYEKGPPKYLPHAGCCLHLEIEPCEREKLKDFYEKVKVGDRVWAKGVWTKDPHRHPWMEIHPVLEAKIIPEGTPFSYPPLKDRNLKPIPASE